MSDALVLREDHGAVARLTLNNPSKLNALSDAMLSALHAALDAIAEDKAIRVVILNGAGKVFCAGHDLKEMQAARESDDGGRAAWLDLFSRLFRCHVANSKPATASYCPSTWHRHRCRLPIGRNL